MNQPEKETGPFSFSKGQKVVYGLVAGVLLLVVVIAVWVFSKITDLL